MVASVRRSPHVFRVGVSFDELLTQSDVVSLHLDLNPTTRHIISGRELAKMKPSAYLINTSRGGLIDEDALYEHLKANRIAGAALDTFRVEPLPGASPLRELENVILTPHMIGQTAESQGSFRPVLVENALRLLRGEVPQYIRNPEVIPQWRQRLLRLVSTHQPEG
jgi:phosphoglycerate dehydrogenase-like enzyme